VFEDTVITFVWIDTETGFKVTRILGAVLRNDTVTITCRCMKMVHLMS